MITLGICPYCGEVTEQEKGGSISPAWYFKHIESRTHRVWWRVKAQWPRFS